MEDSGTNNTDPETNLDDASNNDGPVKPGSFRRAKSRASRACEVCHARKVRCDVTVHMPCTNCAAFGCECRIPEVKHRKPKNTDKKKKKEGGEKNKNTKSLSEPNEKPKEPATATTTGPVKEEDPPGAKLSDNRDMPQYEISNEAAVASASRLKNKDPVEDFGNSDHWDHLLNSSVRGAGRVAFLGSTSNLNLLLEDHTEAYHYSLPDDSNKSRLGEMEKEEVDVLKIRGAFLLPSREVCDDIVETYFEKVHPIIPIVNRTQFMSQYNDPSNPPSLLLLQAMLLAGSRGCNNPALQDSRGSSELASVTFYKRAKALFDANYETDRIAIVQSTALMGWWWENPEELTKNIFYWTRVSIAVAQGFGLHRSVEDSNMDPADKKMWKRIWWALFLRDRYIAIALGRPYTISLDDCDVPMLTEEDLDEDEPEEPSPYGKNRLQNLYFIHSIKLAEIIGYVLNQQFTVGAEHNRRQNKLPNITHCDMAMATWMKNLPEELKYSVADRRSHDFFKALLHAQYYTVLCLVHRSNIVHQPAGFSGAGSKPHTYPSWGIAFQAAHMISMIMENMRSFNELQEAPATVVYNLFSSSITLLYQAESPSKTASERAQKALKSNVLSVREVSKKWVMARMILRLFEHLDHNPKIKEKILQTAKKIRTQVFDEARAKEEREKEKQLGVVPEKRAAGGTFEAPPPPKRRNSSSTSPNTGGGATAAPLQRPNIASPEFDFVTNTPPSGNSNIDNFQPSQLFPEAQDMHFNTGTQGITPVDLSGSSGSSQHGISPSSNVDNGFLKASPEDMGPTNLNIGDWYQYLVNNADGQIPDAQSMMSALGNSDMETNNIS